MSDDPYHQFRQRIDQLTDERDRANNERNNALAKLARCREGRQKLYASNWLLRRSRELWRLRATRR